MKSQRPAVIVINPSDGGQLITRASSERAGHLHYTVKRDFRRELDQEVRREGHDYFYPIGGLALGNQPFPQNQPDQPAESLPINLIHEVRHGNGELAVVVGTETDLYVMFPWTNMFPYLEPAQTPDDIYITGDTIIEEYTTGGGGTTHPPPPSTGDDDYYVALGGGTNISGPDSPPIDPPIDPTTPPATADNGPPMGSAPPAWGEPEDKTVLPGQIWVPVCSDYYFSVSEVEAEAKNYADGLPQAIVGHLSLLLVAALSDTMEGYRNAGFTQVGWNTERTIWWTRQNSQLAKSELAKYYSGSSDPFDGVGDSTMGGEGESYPTLGMCTYFVAYPPAT